MSRCDRCNKTTCRVHYCADCLVPIRTAAFAEGERAGRIAAFKEGGHALVEVARAYRKKYGKAVENIVCLPLGDGIRCLRELSARAAKAKGGAP